MPALIFDCDGVLADTEQYGHLPAFNQTFAEFGVPVQWSVEEYAEKVKIGGGKEAVKPFGALRIDLLCGEHQFAGARGADQTREQPCDAIIAAEADAQIAGGNEGGLRGDANIAGHRNREAGTGGRARKRGDGGLAHRHQRAGEQALALLQIGHALVE